MAWVRNSNQEPSIGHTRHLLWLLPKAITYQIGRNWRNWYHFRPRMIPRTKFGQKKKNSDLWNHKSTIAPAFVCLPLDKILHGENKNEDADQVNKAGIAGAGAASGNDVGTSDRVCPLDQWRTNELSRLNEAITSTLTESYLWFCPMFR